MKPAMSKTELAHVKSMKEKHPNHVPVACRTGDNSESRPGIPVVDKKLLAPKKMKVVELKQVLRKHAKTREGEDVDWDKISLFSQDWPLDPGASMEELYQEYQTDDGILHVGLRPATEAGPTATAAAACQAPGGAGADGLEGSAERVPADVAGECTSISASVFHMPDHDPQVEQFKELPRCTLREGSSQSVLGTLPAGVVLTRAWYGNPSNKEQGQDVTAQVRQRLQERRPVRACSEWLGDPVPGVVKILEIYTSKTRADRKQEEVSRVLEKFPGRVAVRCRQDERPGLPKIDKKMLAPKNMKLDELLSVIRKHATSTMGEVDWSKIRFFSRDLPLDPTADMEELYEEHKDEDGHLLLELRLAVEAPVCVLAEEEDASALFPAAEQKVAELEMLAAVLEREAAAANQKAQETMSQREADSQHMLELVAAKEAAELMACNAEDKALRAEEAMEVVQKKAQEEARKAEVEAEKAMAAAVELKKVTAEATRVRTALEAERQAALQEATMHAERAKAEEAARLAAEERARRAEEWAESSVCEVEHLNEMAKRAVEELKEKSAACEVLKGQVDQSMQATVAAQKQAAKAEKMARKEGHARLLMEGKAKHAMARADFKEQAIQEARERIAALEAKVQELVAEKAASSEKASDDDDDYGFEKVESVSVLTASD